MAEWLFGSLFFILLCLISWQLRGLRKQLTARDDYKAPSSADGNLSFEAWLEELESKGSEILGRMEDERRAVEQTLRQLPVQPTVVSEVGHVIQNVAPAQTLSGLVPVAETNRQPPLISAELADEVQVKNWVRKQPPSTERNPHFTRTKGSGQNWTDMQRKITELVERGVPAPAIAKSLGLSQGEVQLILSKLAANQR